MTSCQLKHCPYCHSGLRPLLHEKEQRRHRISTESNVGNVSKIGLYAYFLGKIIETRVLFHVMRAQHTRSRDAMAARLLPAVCHRLGAVACDRVCQRISHLCPPGFIQQQLLIIRIGQKPELEEH